MAKQFDKPLGQELTEYQEVERDEMDFDPQTGKAEIKKAKKRLPYKVIYTKASPKPFSCKDGEHVWEMIDRHKHIAKCRNCRKYRFLRAVYETISPEGHIVDRETQRLID